jgi:hypothetical protein
MYWSDDQQLHVKVLASQLNLKSDTSMNLHGYALNVGGALTADGAFIQGDAGFRATIEVPNQSWRLSTDGAVREQLTKFNDPYWFSSLSEDQSYLLLMRDSHYCGCDAVYPLFYSVYDTANETITPYPFDVQLTANYHGPGSFVADARGFFFEAPDSKVHVPSSDFAHTVHLNDFVFGASYSKDHQSVIMAVGKQDQTKDFDLLIYSLSSGEQRRYYKVIKGSIPEDQAYGRILPFTFKDDGERIYFTATDAATHRDLNYEYDWASKQVIGWKPPEGVTGWTGFTESSDRIFRYYANGGIYKNGIKVQTSFEAMNYYPGLWMPGTHNFITADYHQGKTDIVMLDADLMRFKPLFAGLPITSLNAVSKDGKWIFVTIKN